LGIKSGGRLKTGYLSAISGNRDKDAKKRRKQGGADKGVPSRDPRRRPYTKPFAVGSASPRTIPKRTRKEV